MSEDKQLQQRLGDLRSRCNYEKSYTGLAKQLLESPLPFGWKLLDELIRSVSEMKSVIQKSVRSIRSFTMLMYVYSLSQARQGYSFYSIYWKGEYEEVAIQLSDLTIFSSWISTHFQSRIAQETLSMVVRIFPLLLKSQGLSFGQKQLQSVLEWVTYFYTPDPHTDKYEDACELIKIAKETRFSSIQDKPQHFLLRKLFELVCQAKNPSSNIFLFLYPMPLMEQEINYFCQIYRDFFSDLAEDGLCNLFKALTAGTICKQVLLIIHNVSHILANEEQFFKLRLLYQKFILPVLAKRAKSCQRVQDMIFQICSLYVLGFLKHCDIGEEGIRCLVKNVGKITNSHIQAKWMQLCGTVCSRYPDLKFQGNKLMDAQMGKHIDLSQDMLNLAQEPQYVWNITLRNGRKHKKYVKVQSKMRGITNYTNECYIISIVHGLQKNLFLQGLLDRNRQSIKGKLKLLDELRILFNEVSGVRRAQTITVRYLKKVSPQQFAKSGHQEDAYEYLIKLFDLMEMEMKSIPGMMQEFKSIFEIEQLSTIFCLKCEEQKISTSKTYVHTIPNTSILTQLTEQTLPDFKCQKCQSSGSCVIRTQLKLRSKIFIVHINRFAANSDGTIRKELSTQRILRKFMDYELVGIICHKGKKTQGGHYVYYHQVSPKRWAHFNDNWVVQFDLEQPYEQFQREWKSQMTPYILFYKWSGPA